MDPQAIPGLSIIPEPWRTRVMIALALSPIIGRAFKAVVNGGGIKGILGAIGLGTNTPKQP